jgi:regulator of RNase E activity RraA
MAYHKEGRLVGTAITVKRRSGDNLMVHKAIDFAEPGDERQNKPQKAL